MKIPMTAPAEKKAKWIKCTYCKKKNAVCALWGIIGEGMRSHFPACESCKYEHEGPLGGTISLEQYCKNWGMKIVKTGKPLINFK